MLFTLGHGQHILVEPPNGASPTARTRAFGQPSDVVSLQAVTDAEPSAPSRDGMRSRSLVPPDPSLGSPFEYYFKAAPSASDDGGMEARLDTLAAAMAAPASDPDSQDGSIPTVFTYLGQFIDHDITANTDREVGPSIIDGSLLPPLSRDEVVANVVNLRNGALELDSLYGDGPNQGEFSRKLAHLMRHPTLKGKMRLGIPTATDGNRPPLPADPAADLLRLGKILGDNPATSLTQAELDALDPALKASFVGADGKPIIQKAIIGDARNDENLIVAQLHCAFLRFHNKVVDSLPANGQSSDELFEKARKLVRWHYQWLVVNAYLPAICDPAMLKKVKEAGAPLYKAFFDAHHVADGARMPLPLEFSVAAFRFGHSMVRAAYDHNRFFGRSEGGSSPIIPDAAPFVQLFNFTGNGNPPMAPRPGVPSAPTLPNNWIIEWERLVRSNPTFPDRLARRIDTQLAPPLADLKNEPGGVFKNLARRNLRRGHRLNIPTAQDCISMINGNYGNGIAALSKAQLKSGPAGGAVDDHLASRTPLWFYVLKEAEENGGTHLGDLGTTLVAETLLGLVIQDKTSYWHASGSDAGRWHPKDGVKPGGHVIDGIPAMLESAGLL